MRSVFIKECSNLLNISEENLVNVVSKFRIKAYYDESQKTIEQVDNNNEKQMLIDTALPHTLTVADFTVKSLSLQDVERVILSLLVNRGENTVCIRRDTNDEESQLENIRIDQFIFDDLCHDGIVFENDLYRKFFDVYADIAEQQQNIVVALRRHENENIRNLCAELEEIPIEASPLWEGDRIKNYIRYVHNDESKSFEDVIRTLQMLKLIKIKSIRNKKQEELKQILQEDDELICLFELQQLNKKIAEIENVLGVVYRQI
jgi:hypothetical protein